MTKPVDPAIPRHDSAILLQGGTEAEILHQDVLYRLKLTPKGGLILTRKPPQG